MFEKLKQVKDYRVKAKKIQSALKDEHVEGSGGWGKVKVTMDGNQNIQDIVIAPELLTPARSQELVKALKDAFNESIKSAQKKMANRVKAMGGLPSL
jgi:DNA-binding YbaB/EbfC family protein